MDAEMTPVPITVSAYLALAARGDLPDRRIELLEGVIVEMSPKGDPHVFWQSQLLRWLIQIAPAGTSVYAEPTFSIAETTAPQPDILVAPWSRTPSRLRGSDSQLLIEVSDTTLAKDLGAKAKIYAENGVPEYWVLDVSRPCIHRHRTPSATGYETVEVFEQNDPIPLPFDPNTSLVLSALT